LVETCFREAQCVRAVAKARERVGVRPLGAWCLLGLVEPQQLLHFGRYHTGILAAASELLPAAVPAD
jgi:hypothetical protein